MIKLRQYQQDALLALDKHLTTKDTNPCIVIPTGGGKSIMIASAIKCWSDDYPRFRCAIVAHRRELVEQNYEEFQRIYYGNNFSLSNESGIFCSALKRRDYDADILFASIDSIYKRSGDFEPFDVIMVDEAHRIPLKGEGKYLTFLSESKKFNKNLRVVGWTATAYRMVSGPICHRDHLLNEICYEIGVRELIEQGYLCNLRSKIGTVAPDTTEVKRNYNGDYIINSLSNAVNRTNIVGAAVREAVNIIISEQRQSAIFFCVDIEHCKSVSKELDRIGIYSPIVTSKTDEHTRQQIAGDFRNGKLHAVCNVNVYTEGFNATCTDCIVLLRPTLSKGLFSQMVGRGLRLHERKRDCLVLDFANCIDEHGPIDTLDGGCTALAVCGQCRESFSRATGKCPICGWIIPKQEIEKLEQKERERRMHGDTVSNKSILSTEPSVHQVDDVYVSRHTKIGSPDSLRVQYRCGLEMFTEWVCLDHVGYAEQKARMWWERIFGSKAIKKLPPIGRRVDYALSMLILRLAILDKTNTITIIKEGKYNKITGYNMKICNTEVKE